MIPPMRFIPFAQQWQRSGQVSLAYVKTAQELDWLTENGCDVGQGYVVAKPIPLHDFCR